MFGFTGPQPLPAVQEIWANKTAPVTPNTFCVRTVNDACTLSEGATHARLPSLVVPDVIRVGVMNGR